tara:strand:- start:4685 stop:5617 length:933 start_codon:yes stop_codon:yes gene_type:complete
MEISPTIVILLSTYNGANYLEEQLDSLLRQTYDDFIVVVRDDGSTDSTQQIINRYMHKNQNKIYKLPGQQVNIGPSASFSNLIQYIMNEKGTFGLDRLYIMLCDQDDIWLKNKLEVQISKMLYAEQKSIGRPILIHSDLNVVDERKKLIAKSFIKYQGLEIRRNQFTNLVLSNLVTGCTILFNEELAYEALPIPDKAIMHDWWLALTASAFGEIIFIDMPLVKYRQHANNTIGAQEFARTKLSKEAIRLCLFTSKRNSHLVDVAEQAIEFQKRFGKSLDLKQNFCLRISSLMTHSLVGLQRIFYRIARAL